MQSIITLHLENLGRNTHGSVRRTQSLEGQRTRNYREAARVHSQCVYLREESLPHFLSCRMHLKNRSEFVLSIFYLHLINSGHADSSMGHNKYGKLSS